MQLLLACWELSISPSIENATRSWLWGVLAVLVTEVGIESFAEWFSKLLKRSVHACMHGSQRNKQTSILAPAVLFDELEATCDGQHAHLPWEIKPAERGLSFATADEAAYPALLCSRMARLLRLRAENLNINLEADINFPDSRNMRWDIKQYQQHGWYRSCHSFITANSNATLMVTDYWQVLYQGGYYNRLAERI